MTTSTAEATPIAAGHPRPERVNIAAAKGRPMLTWVGKRPLKHVTAFPAQLVEDHDARRIIGVGPSEWNNYDYRMEFLRDLRSQCNEECWKDAPFIGSRAPEVGGLLFHGDNKDVVAYLLANGFRRSVNLVFIDPPFDSGADYVREVRLRGSKGGARLKGEGLTLGEQYQYTDIWANDNYLQFMYERLTLLRELLADNGTIFVHCDWHKHHHLRCLLDEVFGADAFRNEIVVKRGRRKNLQGQFETIESLGAETDAIMVYSRSEESEFAKVLSEIRATPAKWKDFWRGNVQRPSMRYAIPVLAFPKPERGQLLWKEERGLRAAQNYQEFRSSGDTELESYWRQKREEYQRTTGNKLEFVNWDGEHIIKYWIPPKELGVIGSLWADIEAYSYTHDFKTEKHESLLARIIEMASDEGDLVFDCFAGSGTALAVAQNLGRRWIGCDINKGAVQTTVKRLRGIIAEQIRAARKAAADERQGNLLDSYSEDEEERPRACAFGFTVWRVNDYDLQIQHNEAVNLACEHIGIERTQTDSYFDGTLGKKLVKIIPFGHPLTPLDLEELHRELDARPDEDRNITVVCLGIELAAKAWLDEWNRLRKTRDSVNKIDVIELRTDPKYGRFMKHEPATARVKMSRVKRGDEARIVVEIQDFISPTIVERLREQAGVLSPKIDDWRAMVDCIYIDPAYDGNVLNVALADVPARKADLVQGKYELPAPVDETTVAVKIIDMLGEEVLVLRTL